MSKQSSKITKLHRIVAALQ